MCYTYYCYNTFTFVVVIVLGTFTPKAVGAQVVPERRRRQVCNRCGPRLTGQCLVYIYV